jgi:hypothetical protein
MKTNWNRRIFSLVLCLVLVFTGFPVAVYAQEAQPTGEITGSGDVENETPIEVDVAEAEDVPVDGSFTLTDDGEPVLEVTHQNERAVTGAYDGTMMNGFYTADFVMPDTGYNVFLTGLTQDNVEQIKQAIIDNYVEGKLFEMRNLGFIDVEKTYYGEDSLMCVHAASSNMLVGSGWAAQAGFTNSDDVFERVIDAFPNSPTSERAVFSWFFNGSNYATTKENSDFVGYFPQYNCLNDLMDGFSFSNETEAIFNRLREGYAASLTLYLYRFEDHEQFGAHAVTLWGFVTDPHYRTSSKEHYKYIFVTDSDSNLPKKGKDRRTAPDVMSMIPIEYKDLYGNGKGYWYSDPPVCDVKITSATTLKPYSPDIPYETSPDATLNRFTTPDIYFYSLVVTNIPKDEERFDELDDEEIVSDPNFWSEEYKPYVTWNTNQGRDGKVMHSGIPIYFCPYLGNGSKVDYVNQGEGLLTRLTLTNDKGKVVFQKDYELPESISFRHADSGSTYSRLFYSFKVTLPAGKYTATAEFNPNHTVPEALYINNTQSYDFSVRDWYMTGDADGDGMISIIDATYISRYLANLPCNISENSLKHCDVSYNGELDVIDATYIQRYIANLKVRPGIGMRHFIW